MCIHIYTYIYIYIYIHMHMFIPRTPGSSVFAGDCTERLAGYGRASIV